MVSNGLKRAVAVLAVGGATVVLGGMAAGTVSAQQTPTPAQSPTPRQGVTGTQGADRQAQQDNFLAALAAKLNVTVDQLKQAMQQTRQELGIPERGQGGRGGHGGPGAQQGRGGPGIGLEAAARAIGIDANQLRQELTGKSLADVARAHGIDPSTVASALKTEATTRIDQAVTAGRLTPDQANAMKQNLDQRINEQLNRQMQADAGRRGGRPQSDNAPTEGNSVTQGTAPIRGFQPRGGVSL
jgi:transposase-like protein